MSKGKKGGKAQPEIVAWDEALVNENTEDDLWHPYIIFLLGESPLGEAHIQALSEAIKDGNKLRKRFVSMTKEDLMKIAQEDSTASSSSAGGKKSKLGRPNSGAASSAQKSPLLHPQVCEKIVTAASSGEPIPLSLMARMIKYVILKRRVKSKYDRDLAATGNVPEQEKKSSLITSDKKRSRSPSGRTSKAGAKKTKESSQPDMASVPVPPKPPTEMKKRGEEDEEAKYINDEPEPGPSCYFVFSGFSSLELFNHFVPIKLKVNALVKITDKEKPSDESLTVEVTEEEQALQASLSTFWENVDQIIRTSPDGCMLRDMARIQLQLKFLEVPQDESQRKAISQVLFDDLAQEVYTLLKLYTQYQHYLKYLQVYTIPLKEISAPPIEGRQSSTTVSSAAAGAERKQECKPNMRLYNSFLNDTPQENATIPLMLHAMVEQVSATLTEVAPPKVNLTPMNSDISAELVNMMNDLTLSKEDKVLLGIAQEETHKPEMEQVVISHGDGLSRRSLNLPASSAFKKKFEEDLLRNSGLNSVFLLTDFTNTEKKADMQSLNNFVSSNSNLSSSQFNHALILLSLDSIELPSASIPPSFNFRQPQASSLRFDHPFDFDLVSRDKSLLPASECPPAKSTNTVIASEEDSVILSAHMLNVSHRLCKLLNYSTFEVFDLQGLLQELISAKDTYPYLEVYEHKHTESLIIVLHTGFNGSPVHSYKTSSHIHTKVGFTNFLDYILEKYGATIEVAVEEDEKKEIEFKESQAEIRDSMMMLKIKEAAERQQQEGLPTVMEEEPSAAANNTTVSVTPADKGKKKTSAMSHKTPDSSKATPAPTKKKAKNITELPVEASPSPCLPEEPQYEPPKLFTGYDLGDIVLLKEVVCSTAFTADGAQLRTTQLLAEKNYQSFTSEVLVLHKGHIFTVSQEWLNIEQNKPVDVDPLETRKTSVEAQHKEVPTPTIKEQSLPAGVPQPPALLQQAQMTASFSNSLRLSYSYYGPLGNGKTPCLPARPSILDAPRTLEISRPPSQQNTKLSKKQLEQQQLLLEQQRLEEERLEAERRKAKAKYDQDCINASRNNKYQQLFVSTECGLNVHCHPMIDLEADPSIVDGTDAFTVIKQWYSNPTTFSHLCQNITHEKARYCHSDGFVVKIMADRSVQVLGAYGHRYRPAVGKELEAIQDGAAASSQDVSETQTSVDQSVKMMASATKVTFADLQKDGVILDSIAWVITTPMGKSYVWKPNPPKRKETEGQTKEAAPEAEDSKDPAFQEEDDKPVIIELEQLRFAKATDPVTNEVYITREDNVVLVQHPNGSCITQFEDGTRFTVSFSKDMGPSDIIIESESFATVHYVTSTKICHLEFPDQSTIACYTTGKYEVMKQGQYEFIIECNGKAEYRVPNSTYCFDHTKQDGILFCKDHNSNTFSVNNAGEIVAEASSPVDHEAFKPRYFILKEDKSAYELHKNCKIEDFIASASACDTTVVVTDALPNQPDVTTTTVIEPVHNTRVFPVSVEMKKDNIVPYNLRCGEIKVDNGDATRPKPKFGTTAGRGLSIGQQGKPKLPEREYTMPVALKYRQFIHFRPLINSKIDKVYDILASYIEQMTEKVVASTEIDPVDKRSTPEKELSDDLQLRFPEFFPLSDIKRSYEVGLEEKWRGSVEPVAPPITDKGVAFIEQSKIEIAEAKKMQKALRNRDIPPYFESEHFNERSPVQTPDMNYFSSKLAKAREGTSMSRSTLKSSTLSLALDDSASPLLSFSSTVKEHLNISPSQVTAKRPVNPTPKIAAIGRESPDLDSSNQEETSRSNVSVAQKISLENKVSPMPLFQSQQRVEPNTKYALIEAPVRRKVKTSSILNGASKLRGFRVSPAEIDFGVLREGSTYQFKLKLKNIGVDSAHFKIRQPPPSTGIKIIYTPGAVAAGLTRTLTVEMFAMAVGAVGDQTSGHISHELQIITETDILYIPIVADVLTGSFYDDNSSFCRQAHGVELVVGDSNRPRPLKV